MHWHSIHGVDDIFTIVKHDRVKMNILFLTRTLLITGSGNVSAGWYHAFPQYQYMQAVI